MLFSLFYKAIKRYELLPEGSHVLLGLSGGKDSLALLQLLGTLLRNPKLHLRVTALHVRMEGIEYESDAAYLQAQADAAGIPLLVRTASFAPDRDAQRTPCFLCSWTRRKVLFEEAQRLGCDALALGHHEDDVLRTALMNLTFNGRFDTMKPCERMQKFPLRIIRPLCLVPEQLLRDYAREQDFQPLRKQCPYDKATQRTQIQQLFDAAERLNPDFRQSLRHAIELQRH